MSSTSIEDQGYTPPDFLEKLFRRTSTVASQTTLKPPSSVSQFGSLSYLPSSPLVQTGEFRSSPSKLLRTHSFVEDQRISTKKFKIFYNAFMEGTVPQVEAAEVWQKFQKSLNNPFDYDRFIEQLRTLKEVQRQQADKKLAQDCDLTADGKERNILSCQKVKTRATGNFRSLRKVLSNQNNQKKRMQKTISYVRTILGHGEKFIRGK